MQQTSRPKRTRRPGAAAGGLADGAAASVTVDPSARRIAWAGLVALAVAMGIGRFAFTPLLPMMLHDGVLDLPAASGLASANYLGYLAGALFCAFQPWLWSRAGRSPAVTDGPRLARAALVATGVLTLAMAWPAPAAWPVWRFAAGVASAVAFVYTSGWCLGELARRGVPSLGGAMFAGPGVGIVLSGLCTTWMVSAQWRASTGWALHGLLASLLTAGLWRVLRTPPRISGAAVEPLGRDPAVSSRSTAPRAGSGEVACLAVAYGLAGFGYIVTATFLPVIARTALPGSVWLDLFWPVFGVGVTCGALLATRLRLRLHVDLRLLLAAAYVLQALGILSSLWRPTLAGFVGGSLLLGLPFTAITFFAMQEVRRLRPGAVAPSIGLLTALYGIGQIIGPPLVARLLRASERRADGFALSLQIAAAALGVGSLLYLGMMCAFPARPAPGSAGRTTG